jgi:hypothetical protein
MLADASLATGCVGHQTVVFQLAQISIRGGQGQPYVVRDLGWAYLPTVRHE